MNIDTLKAIGGTEWQKNEMHRVYFNDLATWYGLKTWHYNTGNISGAQLDGEDISNSDARRIGERIGNAKVWFDVPENKFKGKDIQQKDFDKIVAAIKAKANEVEMA